MCEPARCKLHHRRRLLGVGKKIYKNKRYGARSVCTTCTCSRDSTRSPCIPPRNSWPLFRPSGVAISSPSHTRPLNITEIFRFRFCRTRTNGTSRTRVLGVPPRAWLLHRCAFITNPFRRGPRPDESTPYEMYPVRDLTKRSPPITVRTVRKNDDPQKRYLLSAYGIKSEFLFSFCLLVERRESLFQTNRRYSRWVFGLRCCRKTRWTDFKDETREEQNANNGKTRTLENRQDRTHSYAGNSAWLLFTSCLSSGKRTTVFVWT